MMIQYDPDKKPEISDEALRIGRENGAYPIQIVCDEPDAQIGDHTSVTCIALVHFLPRLGEHILLEDKTTCVVDSASTFCWKTKRPASLTR